MQKGDHRPRVLVIIIVAMAGIFLISGNRSQAQLIEVLSLVGVLGMGLLIFMIVKRVRKNKDTEE